MRSSALIGAPMSTPSRARLILASGSSYKQGVMARVGLPFEAVNADIDETPHDHEAPGALANRLALEKALAIAKDQPDAFIIGCDQVIALGDQIMHKPGSEEASCRQLSQLQGKRHQLICAIALVSLDASISLQAEAIYDMHMRPLSEAAISAYVKRDMPIDCAGSYKLEADGVKLFSSMRGDDHTAIIGLPITRVIELLLAARYIEPDDLFLSDAGL